MYKTCFQAMFKDVRDINEMTIDDANEDFGVSILKKELTACEAIL